MFWTQPLTKPIGPTLAKQLLANETLTRLNRVSCLPAEVLPGRIRPTLPSTTPPGG